VTGSHSATTNIPTQRFLETKTVNYYAKPCNAVRQVVQLNELRDCPHAFRHIILVQPA
jgi:hypothetical protein